MKKTNSGEQQRYCSNNKHDLSDYERCAAYMASINKSTAMAKEENAKQQLHSMAGRRQRNTQRIKYPPACSRIEDLRRGRISTGRGVKGKPQHEARQTIISRSMYGAWQNAYARAYQTTCGRRGVNTGDDSAPGALSNVARISVCVKICISHGGVCNKHIIWRLLTPHRQCSTATYVNCPVYE